MNGALFSLIPVIVVAVFVVIVAMHSFHSIGPSEVGLVVKRAGKKLSGDQLIALNGEAGYQAELLQPGVRFKLWPLYTVKRHDWVQVPPDQIGLVIAQVGQPLPQGAKSAEYKNSFGNFSDVREFLRDGGQRGVQRPVLQPGATVPIHPIGFVVVTPTETFGRTISEATRQAINGIDRTGLQVLRITPKGDRDVVGVVTTLEGPPSGDFASRLGGFEDIKQFEAQDPVPSANQVIQKVLESKNGLHNNYQDFQAFLDNGGCNGLQHDPLSYGAYVLNPLLMSRKRRNEESVNSNLCVKLSDSEKAL